MKTYESCIKSCSEEYIYYDKKLRERRYKFDKFIIVLEDNAPFQKGDDVRIINENDFQMLLQAIKKLKTDKTELKREVKDLKSTYESYFSESPNMVTQVKNQIKMIRNYF